MENSNNKLATLQSQQKNLLDAYDKNWNNSQGDIDYSLMSKDDIETYETLHDAIKKQQAEDQTYKFKSYLFSSQVNCKAVAIYENNFSYELRLEVDGLERSFVETFYKRFIEDSLTDAVIERFALVDDPYRNNENLLNVINSMDMADVEAPELGE